MRAIDGETLWAYLITEGQTKASKYGFHLGDTIKFTPSEIDEIVKKMPTIEPRRKGKWIDTGSGQECDQCHEIQYGYDSFRHFCANCGADMRGEQE